MASIDYNDAVRRAGIIEELGEQLKLVSTDMEDLILEIMPHWRGAAANAYLRQCDGLSQSIQKTSQLMGNAGQLVRRVAFAIHAEDLAAEAEAAALAQAAQAQEGM